MKLFKLLQANLTHKFTNANEALKVFWVLSVLTAGQVCIKLLVMLPTSVPEARSEPQAAQSSLQSNSPALAHVSKLKRAEVQELCHLYCLQLQRLSGMFLIQAVIAASPFLTFCPQGHQEHGSKWLPRFRVIKLLTCLYFNITEISEFPATSWRLAQVQTVLWGWAEYLFW